MDQSVGSAHDLRSQDSWRPTASGAVSPDMQMLHGRDSDHQRWPQRHATSADEPDSRKSKSQVSDS